MFSEHDMRKGVRVMGEQEKTKKLSMWTVVLLTVVPTFGFGNITNNVVALGPASVPSWLIVAPLFFLPLSLFIAELAPVNGHLSGHGPISCLHCSTCRWYLQRYRS